MDPTLAHAAEYEVAAAREAQAAAAVAAASKQLRRAKLAHVHAARELADAVARMYGSAPEPRRRSHSPDERPRKRRRPLADIDEFAAATRRRLQSYAAAPTPEAQQTLLKDMSRRTALHVAYLRNFLEETPNGATPQRAKVTAISEFLDSVHV